MVRQQISLLRRLTVAGLVSSLVVLTSPSSIARAADGDFDNTFDSDGKVSTAITGANDDPFDVAIQSDGKIVVVGAVDDATSDNFVVARYNTDGSLDNTFDSDGIVTTSFGSGTDTAYAVAIQPDGKIVAAGQAGVGGVPHSAVARYNPDGSLDNTFDSDGKATAAIRGTPIDEQLMDVVIQPDGKILGAGWSYPGMVYPEPGIVRFNSNGSVDLATSLTTGDFSLINNIALQPDGKILLGGTMTYGADDLAIWRLTNAGALDNTFNGNGHQHISLGSGSDYALAIGVQPDGKIVAAGSTGGSSNFALVRYTSDGELDPTFSGDGMVNQPIGPQSDAINEMVLLRDGRIMVAGFANNGSKNEVAVARFTNSGALDTTFSSDGYLTYSIGSGHDVAESLAVQRDNKVVVIASSANGSNRNFNIARVNATSSLSTLSSLSTSGATLTETFSSGTTSYTSSVPSNTASFTVTPTITEENASVTVNGTAVTSGSTSAAVPLAVGTNNIPVVVTAQDGITKTTYSIVVNRAAAATQPSLSTNATLSGVSISGVVLTSAFTSSVTSYSSTVSNGTKSLTVTPTVADSTATVKVNGTTVSSGSASASIKLSPGLNTITIVSTAQDGVTTKTYSFAITRDNATVKLKKTITAKSVLSSRDVTLSSTSKVFITVKASSKKYCSVSGTKVKGVKKGNCTVVVAVTPKPTAKVKKPKTTKTTVTIRVI